MARLIRDNQFLKNENTIPFFVRVGLEDIPGVNVVVGTFSHDNIDPADGFIDSFGGGAIKQFFTPPTSEETLYISSTNTGDTSGTIIVTYLDGDFAIKTVFLTPNGQNFVAGPTDFFRLRRILSATGIFLGDIYFSTSNTGTLGVPTDITSIMEVMIAGITLVTSTLYTVPKNTKTLITSIQTSTTGGQNSDVITRTLTYAGPTQVIIEGNIFGPGVVSNDTVTFQSPLTEGLTIVIRLKATQNNSRFSQRFFFVEFEGNAFDSWKKRGI